MNGKTCFFIGSRYASSSIEQQLAEAVEKHITEYGVTTFTVGHYGGFDSLVIGVLKKRKNAMKRLSYIYLPLMHFPKREKYPRDLTAHFTPRG